MFCLIVFNFKKYQLNKKKVVNTYIRQHNAIQQNSHLIFKIKLFYGMNLSIIDKIIDRILSVID